MDLVQQIADTAADVYDAIPPNLRSNVRLIYATMSDQTLIMVASSLKSGEVIDQLPVHINFIGISFDGHIQGACPSRGTYAGRKISIPYRLDNSMPITKIRCDAI